MPGKASAAASGQGEGIRVGKGSWAIAITPDGKTAYDVRYLSSTVTPIATATNTAGKPIKVGRGPNRSRDHALTAPRDSLQGVRTNLDYNAHLARESARFGEVIGAVPAAARVPSCPDWRADDLLWHLAEVQWFWAAIVRERLTRSQAEQLKPERPAGRAGLLAFWQSASRGLAEILAATPADAPAWTWAPDQTVGFIRRRQAHEALIHRVDAELTAGSRSPMDPQLSADGVDEALRLMYGGDVPGWGQFAPASANAILLQATDTGTSWLITPGRFTGTDPGDQASYDEPSIHVAAADQGGTAAAGISGSAADLDCWLWHRPLRGRISRSGDQEALSRLDSVIAPGIN